MTDKDCLDILNTEREMQANSPVHMHMHGLSQRALKITHEINDRYHSSDVLPGVTIGIL